MYQQPLHPQQTWSGPQFAQAPKPPTLSTWASAPVIPTMQNASGVAAPHLASHPSFVPPAPPGVNQQQWQNGRWMYTAPGGVCGAQQPHGPYPPPTLVGWNIPAAWGITPQYYHPPQMQRQPERSYWDTELTDNGLGLANMHIKNEPAAHSAGEGKDKDKAPHTPWAWVPRELDDDDSLQPSSSTPHRHRHTPQVQQPSPIEPAVRQNGTNASAPAGSAGYPGRSPAHARPSHAYFSIPVDQQHQPATDTASAPRTSLPPPAVYSAHIRQHSNPHPPATATHQPFAASGSQSAGSQPPHSAPPLERSHTLAAPTPQRPGQPESFTSIRQLRPTFSPAIVRTPNHYRYDSHPVVPSPRVGSWDEANSGNHSTGVSASANRHLTVAIPAVVPSPRVLPWSAHARVNDGGSPTPAPRHPRSSHTEPSHTARRLQTVQRSYSIPEPPRQALPVSRQNSMPVVASDPDSHLFTQSASSSMANLPQFAELPGALTSLSPLISTVSSESSESTVVRSDSPQPLFIPPRHSRSPSRSSPHRRSRASSRSSSSSPASSSSDSEEQERSVGRHRRRRKHRSPSDRHGRHRTYSGHSGHYASPYGGGVGGYVGPEVHTPQGRSPASSTHRSSSSSNPLPTPPQERRDPGFSLPPPQQPKPSSGSYRRVVRFGFWNRRGDYLTMDKYVVYAPHGRTNPPELDGYPPPTEGYMDHHGNFVKYDPTRKELPESLPRQGQPPLLPYDKFVTYLYL
ncbi:hypothetical protein F5148DRAFT_1146696 [Russula earlei]|uniref:Uncharacterized protein n=1 Tax=Russula earlei TaxID=71964 RepID=A0ACC0UJ47_9AGAM|nr:hypothetical protein F5148DRAFT_1146696 [Russula earlei]